MPQRSGPASWMRKRTGFLLGVVKNFYGGETTSTWNKESRRHAFAVRQSSSCIDHDQKHIAVQYSKNVALIAPVVRVVVHVRRFPHTQQDDGCMETETLHVSYPQHDNRLLRVSIGSNFWLRTARPHHTFPLSVHLCQKGNLPVVCRTVRRRKYGITRAVEGLKIPYQDGQRAGNTLSRDVP